MRILFITEDALSSRGECLNDGYPPFDEGCAELLRGLISATGCSVALHSRRRPQGEFANNEHVRSVLERRGVLCDAIDVNECDGGLGESVEEALRRYAPDSYCVIAGKERMLLSQQPRLVHCDGLMGPKHARRAKELLELPNVLRVCTGSEGKRAEYRRFLPGFDLIFERQQDESEPDTVSSVVVAYKAAAAGEGVLVEDVSLHVHGANIGHRIKGSMSELDGLSGRRAVWTVTLGVLREGTVYQYEARQEGTICSGGTEGYGFEPYFVPDGSPVPCSLSKPDYLNPRHVAVQMFLHGNATRRVAPLREWSGGMQS